MADFSAGCPEFGLESHNIVDTNSYPGSGVPLVTFGEEDIAAIAIYGGEEIPMLPVEAETEDIDVALNRGGKARDRNDGVGIAQRVRRRSGRQR